MFVLLVIWREWRCEWRGRFRINADVFSGMMDVERVFVNRKAEDPLTKMMLILVG